MGFRAWGFGLNRVSVGLCDITVHLTLTGRWHLYSVFIPRYYVEL